MANIGSWQWRIRADWDVLQRCLTVIVLGHLIYNICNMFPPFMMLWVGEGFFELWMTVGVVLAMAKSAARLPVKAKTVFITGCDSGFGLELAKHAHSLGFNVFAGCLLKESGCGDGAKELASLPDPESRMTVLQLDATSDEDWKQSAEAVSEATKSSDSGLWGVVNCASCSTYGEVEWTAMDTYRKMAEVNIFGLVNGIKLFLPLLRKSKGRIVSIGSGISRMPSPSRSAHVLTKSASNGLHECLRAEMAPFGVSVSVVEPGNHVSSASENALQREADAMWAAAGKEVRDAYGEAYYRRRVAAMKALMADGCHDVTMVMEAFENALLDVFPQRRYQAMNLHFKVKNYIADHLPEAIFDLIYLKKLTKD